MFTHIIWFLWEVLVVAWHFEQVLSLKMLKIDKIDATGFTPTYMQSSCNLTYHVYRCGACGVSPVC
jgi:hypothetical protein